MSECVNAEVKEALPDLLNGRLSALDTATMNAHVESCADCRAELELLRQAKTSTLLAPRMDAAKIAAALRARPNLAQELNWHLAGVAVVMLNVDILERQVRDLDQMLTKASLDAKAS